MANFVEIPAEAIERPLQQLGFRRVEDWQARQVVYVKQHECCSCVYVKVYTSIPIGGSGVRRAGKDSIRVVAIYDSSRKNFGIGKFPYIARISSADFVVGKMLKTVKLAWERGQEWFDNLQVKQVMGA
jgi:hypothetical protein